MRDILQQLIDGHISVKEAEKRLKTMQVLELEDFAKIDTGRDVRTGVPEAVFAEGKEDQEIIDIILASAGDGPVMVTRLAPERYDSIRPQISKLSSEGLQVDYHTRARILTIKKSQKKIIGTIGIITAGTSDIPVAEEARIVAQEAGCEVITAYDVGVAGIHRLFSQVALMLDKEVKTIIVAAGMEGALPSVVAGLVDIPVIGVPTSVGYGVGAGGFAALNAMLQSCAPGIAVVNIDNGFGAAVFAVTVLSQSRNK